MARSSTPAAKRLRCAVRWAGPLFAGLAIVLVAVPFGLLLFLVEDRWSPLSTVDGDALHTLAVQRRERA